MPVAALCNDRNSSHVTSVMYDGIMSRTLLLHGIEHDAVHQSPIGDPLSRFNYTSGDVNEPTVMT